MLVLPPRPLQLSLALLVACLPSLPARADWQPTGVDLSRPRILYRAGDLPAIQAKISLDPFPAVLAAMLGRVSLADGVALEDEGIEAHRFKSRAAKDLAFLYAVDRTLVGGQVVAFATSAARQAVGDRVRDLLLNLYPHCRLLQPPPLGGWDRDISTSEELLQYATAYDTLKGAGYDFGADEAQIVERLANLAGELYWSYVDPVGSGSSARIHQNNHRSKSGAALVVAAIALAEHTPDPLDDPNGVEDPADWVPYGLQQVDLVMRWALVAGDGAYGEGPFYFRYAAQNLLPFARAWDRLVDGAVWDAGGVPVPSLWRHPLFRRSLRWELDMTLPDGSLAPQDDGNPGRSFYFGAAPPGIEDAAFAWRWRNAPAPFEADGNVDLAPDAIIVHDPAIGAAPPEGSPSAFYAEGGNAIFRSGWDEEAVVSIVQGESGPAASFGRDRQGRGVYPQSHEHAEPGAFLLHAFGERLLLDPGYFSFFQRILVNRPEHHNMILVDGAGPLDPLSSSSLWDEAPLARVPTDGEASLLETLDGDFLDAATVLTRYGTGSFADPYAGAPRIERRFLFADDRYLAVADRIDPVAGPHDYTWLVQGNGGGSSGGSFLRTSAGGRWSRTRASVDVGFAFDVGPPAFETTENDHEIPFSREVSTHTTLEASVRGETVRGVELVYPTRSAAPAPVLQRVPLPGAAALRLEDAAEGRTVVVAHGDAGLVLGPAQTRGTALYTDGHLALLDYDAERALHLAWAEGARLLTAGGFSLLTAQPGRLGLRPAHDRVELVVDSASGLALLWGLPFKARAADGACGFSRGPMGLVFLWLGHERRVVLRSEAGNSAPGADAGADRRVAVGSWTRLDGRRSCDADRDALTPHWELVSAPPGSDWRFDGTDGWQPRLLADRAGPYRVRLSVRDARGARSRPVSVLVVAGSRCEGGLDEDRDGLIDTADPDCDEGASSAP